MNNAVRVLLGVLLVLPLIGNAVQWEDGSLSVSLSDTDGHPITNATLVVKSAKYRIWGVGGDSDYDTYTAAFDTNGTASISFRFWRPEFRWFVIAPSHYRPRQVAKESFSRTIVPSDYVNVDTNTVEGLARYNELKTLHESNDYVGYTNLLSRFEPKSVSYSTTHMERSLCLSPKRNPQPMYSYESVVGNPRLPVKSYTLSTNDSVEVKHYQDVCFDMKEGRYLAPWGARGTRDPGETADFKIVREEFVTNNVVTCAGWLEFAPGCGAYKGCWSDGSSFHAPYSVDDEAVFTDRVPFAQCLVDGEWVDVQPLLATNEYLVMRTRAVLDDSGSVTNYNYSVLLGGASAREALSFRESIFNPRVNDRNLEWDGADCPVD